MQRLIRATHMNTNLREHERELTEGGREETEMGGQHKPELKANCKVTNIIKIDNCRA